jgi:hypothetical protein
MEHDEAPSYSREASFGVGGLASRFLGRQLFREFKRNVNIRIDYGIIGAFAPENMREIFLSHL